MRLLAAAIGALILLGCAGHEKPVVQDSAPPAAEEDTIVVSGTRVARDKMRVPSPGFSASVGITSFSSPPSRFREQTITEKYEAGDPNPVKLAAKEPLSTFSADVDTASYAVARRYIQNNNDLPPSDAIRVEELVNYFDYYYASAGSAASPFKPTVWVMPSPWREGAKLMHIGVKGYNIEPDETPAANIVFLLDVSGSMGAENKLPLVKKSVELMLGELDKNDSVAIVVYAGAAGVVLRPTPGSQKSTITEALNRLEAGGSTAGGAGLALAYTLAEENFSPDKVNRIILASDGDFNVGVVDEGSLEDFVARKRETGIYLTILGFGTGNYNDVMAQHLAQAGNGTAAYIDTLREARKVLVREFRSTVFPIARDLKFQVEFNPAVVSEYRLIGYETRLLNDEDFNNDAVDAGDIGSGHTVTALYEITLVGSEARLIDELRYQEPSAVDGPKTEFAFLKLRYKLPDAKESTLITAPIRVDEQFDTLAAAPDDARFAAAVAAFGQKLHASGQTQAYSYKEILELAKNARGKDPFGDRAEFIEIVRAAASLDPAPSKNP